MTRSKKTSVSESSLHPRNLHHGRYDLVLLCQHTPELKPFVTEKVNGDKTINFSDHNAVIALNQALLAFYYKVKLWRIPPGYLCPPIPGRADYIHYLADLLAKSNEGIIPVGKQVKVLDIGCGANCIYPIIGSQAYGWQFVGTDVDTISIKCAQNIVQSNSCLKKHIKLVQQKESGSIFKGVIGDNDFYDLTMCNPPFYASMDEALISNQRKQKNLRINTNKRSGRFNKVAERNFGGQKAELWCEGGEIQFLKSIVTESVLYSNQVTWFSSLVSKKDNVAIIKKQLNGVGAKKIEVINMRQGVKVSRVIAWSFFT